MYHDIITPTRRLQTAKRQKRQHRLNKVLAFLQTDPAVLAFVIIMLAVGLGGLSAF